jgi:FkbM family methyltransferase
VGSSHNVKNVIYSVARYLLQRKYLIAHAPAFDLRFRFRIEDAIGRWIFKRGTYETELTDYITHNIELGDESVCIDVGANIGWYALTLARTARRRITILAFEPDPLNFRLLSENIALNGCDAVRALRKAVSDTEETKTLYLYPNKNRGRHSLLPINSQGTVEVHTIALDAFLERERVDPRRVVFMKIDVEGYEFHVVNGARKLLDTVPLILCEYSPGYMRQGGIDPQALISLFREKNYLPHSLQNGELHPMAFAELAASETNDINVFWVKQRPGGAT